MDTDEVLDFYNSGIEKGRLHANIGLIEFARTKEILMDLLPPPPAVIYDIGGGYGEYAWYLASLGYRVHLFDLSEANIRMAEDLFELYPGVTLEEKTVADARSIARPDASADAVLLMGPLYHISDAKERKKTLQESMRLLKPGGRIYAAAITRFATTLWAMSVYGETKTGGEKNDLLHEPAFVEMIEREICDGQHIRHVNSVYHGMTRSFFHHPDELEKEKSLMGFSTHLLAIAQKGFTVIP